MSGFSEGRIYYVQGEDYFFGVDKINLNSNGNLISINWTIYENYGYDSNTGKYIGVGVIKSGNTQNMY